MTLSEYSQLKHSIILAVVQAERHSEILSSIKELFRGGINSIRKFEQINTIKQLLNVLELRDILSEDNVQCLKSIAQKLPNSNELFKKITEYEDYHVCREYGNNYYTTNQNLQQEKEESFIMSSNSPFTRNMTERKKQRIFRTVTDEIGSFWRDLGRFLNIREGRIDEIDSQNKTLTDKATNVMKAFEFETADPDRWFFNLCNALEQIRRKDLVKSIQEIMAMNI